MLEELHMAELLCTRLCHDLTGPIGAVNNGAEFLSEEGFNLQNQAVDLIVTSAFSAVTRLQFYRMAYGKMRDSGEANLADKKKLVTDFFADTKIIVDWPDSHTDAAGVSISLKMSRLILNMLVVASGALVRGGNIAVRIEQDASGNKLISVNAKGPGLKWDTEMADVFNGKTTLADLTPKNVQAYLTKCFAQELEATLVPVLDTDTLTLQVTQPAGQSL